jgi:uncharacterized protein YciI
MQFVFLYFMKPLQETVREIVPLHVQYWKTRELNRYSGGPFADRSGGLISFETTDLARATELVDADPFVIHGLIERKWIKEWLPE